MNQISGTTPADAPTHTPVPQPAAHGQPAETDVSPGPGVPAGSDAPAAAASATADGGAAADTSADAVPAADTPGFRSRGSARRRARFLRKARELAYRDLGGLVFNLHRFGQRNDALVLAKLTTLTHIDAELREIERWLRERQPITVLREAGITACPRCAAIHSSEDSFCPNCGLPMSRHVDLPAGFQAAAPSPPSASVSPPSASVSPPSPSPSVTSPSAPGASAPAPSAPGASAPTPAPVVKPASAPASPAAEDGPTEILRPPADGA
ncbi:MAG TPA: zinc ribbon domain-containing protein [Solirubrobacteraceae bacterium]|nr:zinc ribbon domain-containing protein [Solirubrobacteraceae bacterium]